MREKFRHDDSSAWERRLISLFIKWEAELLTYIKKINFRVYEIIFLFSLLVREAIYLLTFASSSSSRCFILFYFAKCRKTVHFRCVCLYLFLNSHHDIFKITKFILCTCINKQHSMVMNSSFPSYSFFIEMCERDRAILSRLRHIH